MHTMPTSILGPESNVGIPPQKLRAKAVPDVSARGKKGFLLVKHAQESHLPPAHAPRQSAEAWSGVAPDVALLSPTPHRGTFVVFDTNAVLHQMDVIEHDCPALRDVIILQTVADEVRHRNLAIYNRLLTLLRDHSRRLFLFSNEHHKETYTPHRPGESPNDRSDRAIRLACSWYTTHVPSVKILLVTNDAANLKLAKSEGLTAMTMREYVKSLRAEFPLLSDLLAASAESDASIAAGGTPGGAAPAAPSGGPTHFYPTHIPMSKIQEGLRAGTLFSGAIRLNRDCWFEGTVGTELPNGDFQSISISGREAVNRATEGDIVAVELLPGSDAAGAGEKLNAKGRVVGIIKRNWRPLCGSLEPSDGAFARGSSALFCPVNAKFPRVRIETRQKESLMDKRIVVVIDAWPPTSHYPLGHYTKTLGVVGDRITETDVLLIEHEIPTREFSAAVMACLPSPSYHCGPEASPGRVDLRHLDVMSVDPPGCKDIDDALHVRELPNGNYEVGVHIADVTHFVIHNSAMDKEAADRANTTYLVERRLDMLPGLLTENLCSLKSKVDRLAFSVLWEMKPNADIVSYTFCKSSIHSKAAMSYAEAQALLDNPHDTSVLAKSVKLMNKIAVLLRRKRIEAGALTLASAEVRFLLDSETHDPLDVASYQMRDTNEMVEEFMLLANTTVAKKITEAYPRYALLRRHPTPSRRRFDYLLAAAEAVGVKLDVSSSLALAQSLDAAVVKDNPYFNKLLRILTTRCMEQAVYFGSGELCAAEYHHYGLATPIYTHFTSPIRRYADVVVHRELAAAIGIAPLPHDYEDKSWMRALTQNMNRRHVMAQLAGRASVTLHTHLFFKGKVIVESGLVMKVRKNGAIVFIPRFGIEGIVYVAGRKEDKDVHLLFEYDEVAQRLTSRANPKNTIRVFDEVKIAVIVEHLANHRTEMVYKLVSPPFHDMPVIAEGVSYYESDSDGAAVADGTPGIDKKRKVESSQKPRKQKKNKAA